MRRAIQAEGIIRAKAGNSLVVQWLGLCASTAGGMGSIPDRRTEIPQAAQHGQKKKKKKKSKDKVYICGRVQSVWLEQKMCEGWKKEMSLERDKGARSGMALNARLTV